MCEAVLDRRCPTRTWPTWWRGRDEFWPYIRELRWAQEFALLNREEMMDRVSRSFADWLGRPVEDASGSTATTTSRSRRTHFGKEVWLSRKGAIEARAGHPG